MSGIWVLFVIFKIQAHGIILVKYMTFDDPYICLHFKEQESKNKNLPMTCLKEREDNV